MALIYVEWDGSMSKGNGMCKGEFSVDGCLYILFNFVNGNIKVVYCIVLFSFCGKV